MVSKPLFHRPIDVWPGLARKHYLDLMSCKNLERATRSLAWGVSIASGGKSRYAAAYFQYQV
jgi:hypothetical protein